MSPEVTAAWIAAGGVVLTVIATVVVQIFGRRATNQDTQRTLKEQREQLDRTLEEQGKQLDRTLAEQRTRTLNERFATAAGQLGDDKPPAVRLAGVYAMAGLADDWPENRQTCVDVLCAYLRLPYELDPGEDAAPAERSAYRAAWEVRHTVVRVITAHLRVGVVGVVSWQGLDFDFTGAVFDGGDFSRAKFSAGHVSFTGAEFSAGHVGFAMAEFSGASVSFDNAVFSGGTISFDFARFSGGHVSFIGAEFSAGRVLFRRARFSGSQVRFDSARSLADGAAVTGARFSGGTVDFSDPGDWSVPPVFSWTDKPPPGVKLPRKVPRRIERGLRIPHQP